MVKINDPFLVYVATRTEFVGYKYLPKFYVSNFYLISLNA